MTNGHLGQNGNCFPSWGGTSVRYISELGTDPGFDSLRPQSGYNPLMPKPAKQSAKLKPASKAKPGPKPEVLEPFTGTFEQAIDKALGKKKPAGGWPKQ